MGKDKKEKFGGVKAAEQPVLKPIKCKKCNRTMRWQVSSEDCLVHCDHCRRAVVVSDWETNAKLFGK